MNLNCSLELKQLLQRFAAQKAMSKSPHFLASACEYKIVAECATSKSYKGIHYHDTLKDAINKKLKCEVGDQRGIRNDGLPLTVGVCAEQHAANKALKKYDPCEKGIVDVSDLVFAEAIRIKTKQGKPREVPPCDNCNTLFSK